MMFLPDCNKSNKKKYPKKTLYKIRNNPNKMNKIRNDPKKPCTKSKTIWATCTKSETIRNNLHKIRNNLYLQNPKQVETTFTKSEIIRNNPKQHVQNPKQSTTTCRKSETTCTKSETIRNNLVQNPNDLKMMKIPPEYLWATLLCLDNNRSDLKKYIKLKGYSFVNNYDKNLSKVIPVLAKSGLIRHEHWLDKY